MRRTDDDNEVRLDLGLVPVRLDPEGRGEVVWSHRIDPARAIIRNIPLPESGFCEGDLVGLSALSLHHADEVLGAWAEGEVGRRIQKLRAVERRLSNHVWIAS